MSGARGGFRRFGSVLESHSASNDRFVPETCERLGLRSPVSHSSPRDPAWQLDFAFLL